MVPVLLPLLLLLGAPSHALAYLTPEEVLLEQQASFYEPTDNAYLTPNTRRVRTIEQQRTIEREARLQSPFNDQGTEEAAAARAAASSSAQREAELEAQREAERVRRQQAAASSAAADADIDPEVSRRIERLERMNTNDLLGSQENPLAPTGPEMIAMIVLGIAVVATVIGAWRMKGWRVR